MDNDAFDDERFLSRKVAQNMGFQRAKPFGGWVAREGGAFPGPPAVPVPSLLVARFASTFSLFLLLTGRARLTIMKSSVPGVRARALFLPTFS